MTNVSDMATMFFIILYHLVHAWVAERFYKNFLEISGKREKLFVPLLFGGWAFMAILYEIHPVPNILYSLMRFFFLLVVVLLLFQADKEKKILAVSLLAAILKLAGNFSDSFLCCLVLIWRHTVNHISVPFINEWESNLIICIRLAIETGTLKGLMKPLHAVFRDKLKKWYVILAMPLLAVTAVIDVADWGASNGILVRSGGNLGLYYDQLFSHGEMCVLTALSMFAAGFYVFGMNRIYLEQQKSGEYRLQITAYKMLEEQYSQSERLRHDMKNHIIALSGLLENKEWEKMGSYLRDMKDSGSLGGSEEITGNRVVDALLYRKRRQAEREGIKWECDVQIPKECCINEFDLCVLFGNLLDNALEACERVQSSEERFITVQARTVKKCFLLELKNSADMTEQYGAGYTNKENPQEHGIGLLNVRDMVHRYNGVMNIEAGNGSFVISVLVPLNDAVHDIKQAI